MVIAHLAQTLPEAKIAPATLCPASNWYYDHDAEELTHVNAHTLAQNNRPVVRTVTLRGLWLLSLACELGAQLPTGHNLLWDNLLYDILLGLLGYDRRQMSAGFGVMKGPRDCDIRPKGSYKRALPGLLPLFLASYVSRPA